MRQCNTNIVLEKFPVTKTVPVELKPSSSARYLYHTKGHRTKNDVEMF